MTMSAYVYDRDLGIWVNAGRTSIGYSDGASSEARVAGLRIKRRQ